MALELLSWPLPVDMRLSYTALQSDWFAILLLVNVVFLANRAFQRAYFTTSIYGWKSGLMAIPRIIISNLVNFYAVLRAIRIYTKHLRTGEPIGWDKTPHVFLTDQVTDMHSIAAIEAPTVKIPVSATKNDASSL